MLLNREQAAKRAENYTRFGTGMCQLWTRTVFGADSAGDRDGDGDADAVDGWRSEPDAHKHFGDRNPPRGVPVSFNGGSRGFGHRAVSLGNGRIRSTDMSGSIYMPGVVGTTTIRDIEKAMGVNYLGWSNTITGKMIPMPPPPARPVTRGKMVDAALAKVQSAKAKKNSDRAVLLDRAERILMKIKPL